MICMQISALYPLTSCSRKIRTFLFTEYADMFASHAGGRGLLHRGPLQEDRGATVLYIAAVGCWS